MRPPSDPDRTPARSRAWAWGVGMALPLLSHARPELSAAVVGAGGGFVLAAAWRRGVPSPRAIVPYAVLGVLALPGCLLAGAGSVLMAIWALSVLSVGLAAEHWGDDARCRTWAAVGLRVAAVATAGAVIARHVVVGPIGSPWYRQLAPGEMPWDVSPFVGSSAALGLLACGLPHSVSRLQKASRRALPLLEAALITAALVVAGRAIGCLVIAALAGRLTCPRSLPRGRMAVIALAGLLAICAGAYVKREALRYRLRAPVLAARESVRQREYAWHVTTRIVADNPLTGTGLGRFSERYGPYRRGDAAEPYQAVSRPLSPRNDVLLAAAELGLPGTLAGLWLALPPLLSRRRGQAVADDGFRAGAVALCLVSVTEGCLFNPLCLPAAAASLGVLRARSAGDAHSRAEPPTRWYARGAVMLALCAGIVPLMGHRIPAPAAALDDGNDPAALVARAESAPNLSDAEREALLRRALVLYPAVREAAARAPGVRAGSQSVLAEAHARAADRLADLCRRTGRDAAEESFRRLGRQIRAAAEGQWGR